MLMAKQVDGIIIFPTGGNIRLIQENEENPVFHLFLWTGQSLILGIETVLLDNEKAAELAVDQFVESGYRKIAIVTTSIIRNISPRIERIQGYKNALERYQLTVNPDYVKTANTDAFLQRWKNFHLEEPPEAILAEMILF